MGGVNDQWHQRSMQGGLEGGGFPMQFNPTMTGGGPGQPQDGSMVGGWDAGQMGGDKIGGLKGIKAKMGRPKGAKDTKPRTRRSKQALAQIRSGEQWGAVNQGAGLLNSSSVNSAGDGVRKKPGRPKGAKDAKPRTRRSKQEIAEQRQAGGQAGGRAGAPGAAPGPGVPGHGDRDANLWGMNMQGRQGLPGLGAGIGMGYGGVPGAFGHHQPPGGAQGHPLWGEQPGQGQQGQQPGALRLGGAGDAHGGQWDGQQGYPGAGGPGTMPGGLPGQVGAWQAHGQPGPGWPGWGGPGLPQWQAGPHMGMVPGMEQTGMWTGMVGMGAGGGQAGAEHGARPGDASQWWAAGKMGIPQQLPHGSYGH